METTRVASRLTEELFVSWLHKMSDIFTQMIPGSSAPRSPPQVPKATLRHWSHRIVLHTFHVRPASCVQSRLQSRQNQVSDRPSGCPLCLADETVPTLSARSPAHLQLMGDSRVPHGTATPPRREFSSTRMTSNGEIRWRITSPDTRHQLSVISTAPSSAFSSQK
jgi:hypothetical protein